MTARVARLEGHLLVRLALNEELRAIGAPQARRERNRAEVARLRAELERLKNGDLTDATGTTELVG